MINDMTNKKVAPKNELKLSRHIDRLFGHDFTLEKVDRFCNPRAMVCNTLIIEWVKGEVLICSIASHSPIFVIVMMVSAIYFK